MTTLQREGDALPLHMQVAQIIKARIEAGIWRDGDVIPTEKTLCAEFDVARGTVRQALQTLEAEGVLRRERGRGTFVTLPKLSTVNATTRRQQLAFIVPYVRDSSVSTIFMGFQQWAQSASFSASFTHVNNETQQQTRVIEQLIAQGTAGIALYPIDSEVVEPLRQLAQSRFPLVLVDRYLKNVSTDFVMTDHFAGALRVVRYLLDLGHERIGFTTWLSPAVSMEHRQVGYTQALRERGIAYDPALVCFVEGYPTIDLQPMKALLQQPNRPTAIFAANDQIAVALYRAATSIGLQVPHDLAVVGFDNLDLADQLDPPLTTMAQPFSEIGRAAADILLQRIDGATGDFQITLAPQLMTRASCLPLAHMRSGALALNTPA